MRMALSVLAALLIPLLVASPVAAEDVRPTHGTACLSPIATSGAGCATGSVSSPYACGHDEEGTWACEVTFTLSFDVFGPLACGEATSPWTQQPTACASVMGSGADERTAALTFNPPPEGLLVRGMGKVCVYPLGTDLRTCQTWDHAFLLPGDPQAQATQAIVRINEVATEALLAVEWVVMKCRE